MAIRSTGVAVPPKRAPESNPASLPIITFELVSIPFSTYKLTLFVLLNSDVIVVVLPAAVTACRVSAGRLLIGWFSHWAVASDSVKVAIRVKPPLSVTWSWYVPGGTPVRGAAEEPVLHKYEYGPVPPEIEGVALPSATPTPDG